MRRGERSAIMCLIYELDLKDSVNLAETDVSEFSAYQLAVTEMYLEKKAEIDSLITRALNNWTLDSIAKVDLAILRLCVTEAVYYSDVPFKIAINEAVELAKIYGDNNSSKFVNGMMRSCMTIIQSESVKDKDEAKN